MTRAGAFAVGAAALAAGVAACGGGTQSTIVPCTPESGNICTIAGTGTAGDGADHQAALRTNLYSPQDMTVGPDGRLFIVDWNNHRIRVLEPDDTLSIVAGIGELGVSIDDPTTNRLNHPTNVTFDSAGNLVIAAWHNSRIKVVPDLTTGETVNTCGNGLRTFGCTMIVPIPRRRMISPLPTRYSIARRMVGLDRPSSSASWISLSNRLPGGRVPASIAAWSAWATWKYNGTGLPRSIVTTAARSARGCTGMLSCTSSV